jgi:hypothetical protein
MIGLVDLSDDALANMVDRERYGWRDDFGPMIDRAAHAHWKAVNAVAPDWLQDTRLWEDLPTGEHEHHRAIARAVIAAAGGPVVADS